MKISTQDVVVIKKANSMIGIINENKVANTAMLFYKSMIRTHLEYSSGHNFSNSSAMEKGMIKMISELGNSLQGKASLLLETACRSTFGALLDLDLERRDLRMTEGAILTNFPALEG